MFVQYLSNLISADEQIVDFGNGVHNIFVEDPIGMNIELFGRAAAPGRGNAKQY